MLSLCWVLLYLLMWGEGEGPTRSFQAPLPVSPLLGEGGIRTLGAFLSSEL